ncbi:MAG: hypothetical protein Q8877_02755, partial [Sweet potato little leaf phytoplasma]|nr:hypothetical protein [Sweet potato little leaf phytoplasma]
YGFIETPFFKVIRENGKSVVSPKYEYLTSIQEENRIIATSSCHEDFPPNGLIFWVGLTLLMFLSPKVSWALPPHHSLPSCFILLARHEK